MADKRWSFLRAGGVDQVVFASGKDVAALSTLDKKLWVALACPVQGTEIDDRTLDLLDTDRDSRIRPPEILAAIDWLGEVLTSHDALFEKGDALTLASIDESKPEGKAVRASAKRILADRGKEDAKAITLADVQAMQDLFASTRLNGDGIVPAESAEDETIAKAITDIVTHQGSVVDRGGKAGVDQKIVDEALQGAAALVAWEAEGEAHQVLGAGTAAAFDALVAVEAKIDDFFTRCRIAAFDERGATLLAPSAADLTALGREALTPERDVVAGMPLARIDASGVLSLDAGTNPAWAARLATFRDATVRPLLGETKQTLTEAELGELRAKLAGYRAWRAKKPAAKLGALGLERVRELAQPAIKDGIGALIAADAALEPEYAKIAAVEKAVRYRRDLLLLLRNFVSFADFYGKKKAVFQAGTLYLDRRACTLCIRVNDPGKHAKLAGLAKAYLAYCDCTRKTEKGDEKMTIVAAFTDGDVDNLMVGRNGVFYDRKGNDWDATITSIIENPLSIRQAFWSPYKKLLRTIEEMVAKRAADKEKESSEKIDTAAKEAANADKTPVAAEKPAEPAAAAKPEEKKPGVDVGAVAAIGVAVAGISSFLGLMFGKFVELGPWMPVGVLALLLGISGPSMMIAWLKLRQRNIGPILDASGWAVNTMCRINVPFGRSLTTVAELPEGATRTADDPYAEKPTPWALYAVLAIVLAGGVAWTLGKLDAYLPEKAQARVVLGRTETTEKSEKKDAAEKGDKPAAAPAPAPEKK